MRGGDTAFSRAFDRGAPAEVTPPSPLALEPGEVVAEGATDASSAPAARPLLLGTLRSVRSQAYQNPEPGPEAAHRVGSHNRVEQARILASGGATEFARRVDRGDVETGRYRP